MFHLERNGGLENSTVNKFFADKLENSELYAKVVFFSPWFFVSRTGLILIKPVLECIRCHFIFHKDRSLIAVVAKPDFLKFNLINVKLPNAPHSNSDFSIAKGKHAGDLMILLNEINIFTILAHS